MRMKAMIETEYGTQVQQISENDNNNKNMVPNDVSFPRYVQCILWNIVWHEIGVLMPCVSYGLHC